jgi:hypothetical protein
LNVRERKERAGFLGTRRGKEAAVLDATGASLGSFGLAAFGSAIRLMIVPTLGHGVTTLPMPKSPLISSFLVGR